MLTALSGILLKLFNMSITACFFAFAVIVLRKILKKAPKAIICILWGLVALRLICPFTIESVLSLIPSKETIPDSFITSESFEISSGFSVIDTPVNEYLGDHYYEGVTVPTDNGANIMGILSIVWLLGIAAMVLYAVISVIKVKSRVKFCIPLKNEKDVYLADNIETAFILGVIKPKIYIPSHISEEDISLVLAHERAHIKRLDHFIKPLGFLLLSVYWFNPIIWLCYVLFCRDIESACDEKVLKTYGADVKKDYSKALIKLSTSEKRITACPLAFGETGVKERVVNVLNYKKPAFWIIVVAIIATVAASVCFLTNPKTSRTYKMNNTSGYNVSTAQTVVKSTDLEEAVHLALLSDGLEQRYAGAECFTEGHIILGKEVEESTVYVYMFQEISGYGFFSGKLVESSGSSGHAVAVFEKSGKEYQLKEIRYPFDGSESQNSIKKMMPKKYHKKALNGPSEKEYKAMNKQCVSQAQKYLESIGRKAEVYDYSEVSHTFPSDLFNITTEQENNLGTAIDKYTKFNSDKGNYEKLINGKRYVFETEYDLEKERIILTQYEYETKRVAEYHEIDVKTAKEIANVTVPEFFKPAKPTPDAPINREWTTVTAVIDN